VTRGTLLGPDGLTWILGIEDTCVYPADGIPPDSRRIAELDEHRLTEHHLHWREDLRQVAALGADAVRYGMSWPLVHLGPGEFNWQHLDEVVAFAVDELGLDIIADLVHYGTPRWLPKSFADPRFVSALAEFAGALASRYAGRIRGYTPVNEPLTTASFSGLRGVWPPHHTGWDGWVSVAVPIALGAATAMHAIRAADPTAVIVHVEASTAILPTAPEQAAEAELLEQVGWLCTDLTLGRVDQSHPMHHWLLRHGATPAALQRLLAMRAAPDVLGVNYYPDLTPRRLRRIEDRVVQVAYDGGVERLAAVLRGFCKRYGLPIAVTETSIEGDDSTRSTWLVDAVSTVKELAQECDLRGFTWWPLLDFVDWSFASHGANVEEFAVETIDEHGRPSVAFAPPLGDPGDGKTAFLRRMGLVRLEEQADGSLERVRTAAAHAFAAAVTEPGTPLTRSNQAAVG
jgi:beta-glucosidase